MVFGLFGGEKEPLKSSLSKEAFLAEFETTMKTFGIEPEKGDKAKDYDKIEATAIFLFEQVMKVAVAAKTINSKRDLEAAAMLGIVLIHCLGRNSGMSKTQLQFLMGKVPQFVLTRTLTSEQNASAGKAITKAIIKYAHKIGHKRFRFNVQAVEDNVIKFIVERKPDFYANLAGDIGRFI